MGIYRLLIWKFIKQGGLFLNFPVIGVSFQKKFIQVVDFYIPEIIDGWGKLRALNASEILNQFSFKGKRIYKKQRGDVLQIRTFSKVLTCSDKYLIIPLF